MKKKKITKKNSGVRKNTKTDAVLSEFISISSHQLLTPVSTIKWYLEQLLSDTENLTDKQTEYLELINRANVRTIRLVNYLLNAARVDSGRLIIEPKPTLIATFVNEIVDELEEEIKSKHQTVTIHAKNLPTMNLDQDIYKYIVRNLITNANKYSPKYSDIKLNISIDDNDLITQVKDSGYGIPKEDQKKIFQKFARAGNIKKIIPDGNGLGLYVVKQLCDMFDGRVWFESIEEEGTSFWFTVPLYGMKQKEGSLKLSFSGDIENL